MLKVFAPYDLSPVGELPIQGEGEVMGMLERAQGLGAPMPVDQRIALLRRVANRVEERLEELAHCIAEEGGKPLVDSEVEAGRAVQGIRSAMQTLGGLTGTQVPMGITEATRRRVAFTVREPIGTVVAISAFNHPLNLIIHQVIPAVAAGCPVIVKPALTTPLSCKHLVDILAEAGLPAGWCQMAICDDGVAEKLATDPRVAYVSFIGSLKVGWELRSKVAPGTRVVLEHGGAAPVILLEDTNLEGAIPRIVKGAFYHAGQVCVSVQRLFVPKKRMEEVAERLVAEAKGLVVGDPTRGETHVGPLISPKEVDRIEEWVKGHKLLCGGHRIGKTCFEPTVVLDPPKDSLLSTQEIFGPVICLYPYEGIDEAIGRANSLPFAFQSAVFGKEIDRLLYVAKRLKGTGVMINDHTAFRADWMPFGGREQSGLGMGGIPYAIRDMAVEKLIVIRSESL
ncbi:MAG: aldehyde dehydrogenase family protein [Parachlamydiales bacterium]